MTPLERALEALEGLSIGDAFGETYFGAPQTALERIRLRTLRPGTWRYTDDTEMALSVVAVLADFEGIDQDELAEGFQLRMSRDRGYGAGAFSMLSTPGFADSWRELSAGAFSGTGSYGNGAAMRAAPIGAYFADDLERTVSNARLAAEVTHAHAEGIAGGIAVAAGAALLTRRRGEPSPAGRPFLEAVRDLTPDGETRRRIDRSLVLGSAVSLHDAVRTLGNGTHVSAQDTVPLCLWIASRHSHDYEAALWETVAALGDRDTTCAIVGGMVVCHTGADTIPASWKAAREPLPKITLGAEVKRHFFGKKARSGDGHG